LIIEPGRFIVGNAGILVTKILYIKKTPYKKFIVVDCGMNDLLRPALYGAYHKILSLKKSYASRQRYDIVGPVCESTDFLAKERMLPSSLKEGDFLAVMGAGAYGFSMSSNYNSRLRPAEVMVKGNHYYIIRKRETYPDLVKKEIIPHFLKDNGNDRFC
jgi:diaminopimelate decarboxylase